MALFSVGFSPRGPSLWSSLSSLRVCFSSGFLLPNARVVAWGFADELESFADNLWGLARAYRVRDPNWGVDVRELAARTPEDTKRIGERAADNAREFQARYAEGYRADALRLYRRAESDGITGAEPSTPRGDHVLAVIRMPEWLAEGEYLASVFRGYAKRLRAED